MSFSRYVALGDSFTEGVGDSAPELPNGVRGWADRVAGVLAADDPGFGYANLAIRGRKLLPILAEQIEPAIALRPDLVTLYAGGNDVLRPRVDIDALMAAYDEAVGRLIGTGATVAIFTPHNAADGGRVAKLLRGRFAILAESVREIADRHNAVIVDFWRLSEYQDWRFWDSDRLHMSPAGHQRMAMAVLDALGVQHNLQPLPLPELPTTSPRDQFADNLRWTREFLGPWIGRRLRGTSSGDDLDPKYPEIIHPVSGSRVG